MQETFLLILGQELCLFFLLPFFFHCIPQIFKNLWNPFTVYREVFCVQHGARCFHLGEQGLGEAFLFPDFSQAFDAAGQQQIYHTQTLVKGGMGQLFQSCLPDGAAQDFLYLIITLIFPVEFQIVGEFSGDFVMLDVLAHHLFIRLLSQLFIDF